MDTDEKVSVLREDNERLFALTNKYEAEIEQLKQRLGRVESFLSQQANG